MVKEYLIGYEVEPLQALNTGGTAYVLTFVRVNFWGRKRIVKSQYIIPDYLDTASFLKCWDWLISTKTVLK